MGAAVPRLREDVRTMRPVEEMFDEEWVRETLLLALPDGIVKHRAPEVVREMRQVPPTFTRLRDAFWEPLKLFIRDPHRQEYQAITDRLIERLEDAFAEDDRPYISEWLAERGLEWGWKDKGYWKSVFQAADREARLPNCHKPEYSNYGEYIGYRPRSRRTRDASWSSAIHKYAEKWRLPDEITLANTRFKKPSDWVRMIRHIERNTKGSGTYPRLIEHDLDVRYGAKVAKVIQSRIDLMTKDRDFVDNIRVAACDNPAEMSHYKWQKKQGCCGCVDIQIDVKGRPFIIGCNYGH